MRRLVVVACVVMVAAADRASGQTALTTDYFEIAAKSELEKASGPLPITIVDAAEHPTPN